MRVPDLDLRHFGAVTSARGQAVLVSIECDNRVLFDVLDQDGHDRALVVQVRSDRHPAVFGQTLAELAAARRWECVVVDGAVRDVARLRTVGLCVAALSVRPFRLREGPAGQLADRMSVGGIELTANDTLLVDEDGLVAFPAGSTPPPDAISDLHHVLTRCRR